MSDGIKNAINGFVTGFIVLWLLGCVFVCSWIIMETQTIASAICQNEAGTCQKCTLNSGENIPYSTLAALQTLSIITICLALIGLAMIWQAGLAGMEFVFSFMNSLLSNIVIYYVALIILLIPLIWSFVILSSFDKVRSDIPGCKPNPALRKTVSWFLVTASILFFIPIIGWIFKNRSKIKLKRMQQLRLTM